MSGAMLHGLGDCTQEFNCGCLQANGQSNSCRHYSASGVDQTFGPDKVWRCDHCGLRWTEGER